MTALRYRALDAALAKGIAPDWLLRAGSWVGSVQRERHELRGGIEGQEQRLQALLERMRSGLIAEATQTANQQHYELPARFFSLFLGPRMKYSGCLWDSGAETLEDAEEAMLQLTCERAQLRDGMSVLDLGCGWGSLTLWIAEHYPACRVTSVSNSAPQRQFIEQRVRDLRLKNVEVITADINVFSPLGSFDRVISVEMFEHMRNWRELFDRISEWLSPDGRLFIHVFSHRIAPYLFTGTWAAERFFTAGLMPSHDLPLHFQQRLVVEQRWAVPGVHYARTLDAWLSRLDANCDEALRIFVDAGHTQSSAKALLASWRLFLISTQVIWSRGRGNRWMVSHYRFVARPRRSADAVSPNHDKPSGP